VEVIMSNRDDKIAELLRRLSSRVSGKVDRLDCPDEEKLSDFLAGHLEKDAREALEAHLAKCSFCMDDLVAAYKSGELAGIETVPQRLIDNVTGLVQGRKVLFDLVVHLTKGTLELIRASVPVSWPALAVDLRGTPHASAGKVLQLSKAMGRFNVTAELEALEEGGCLLDVHVKDELGRPAEGVRLTLSSEGREQASFLTPAGGEIVFEGILPADYQLAVFDGGGLVGTTELRLTQ
jgi:hypothetical protein